MANGWGLKITFLKMLQHFNEMRYICNELCLTCLKKLGKSLATASQPGQRQRPLTNSMLVTSGVLEGRKQYYFQFLSFTSDVAGSTFRQASWTGYGIMHIQEDLREKGLGIWSTHFLEASCGDASYILYTMLSSFGKTLFSPKRSWEMYWTKHHSSILL